MKKAFLIFICLILVTTNEFVSYANSKNGNGNKPTIEIILNSIPKVKTIDVKQKLYLEAVKELGKNKDIERFEKLLNELPEELKIYQKKIYENFFLEYAKVSKIAFIKKYLADINDRNLKDHIVEKLSYQALTDNSKRNYDLLLPLVTQNVIRSRVALLLIEYFLNINELDKANDLIESISFPAQKDAAYSLIAIEYAKIADYERCNMNINNIMDIELKQKTFSLTLAEFAKKSLFKISIELLNRISIQENYEYALIILMNQYVDEKKYDTAYQLFQSIKTQSIKDQALYYLGVGFAKHGEVEGINNVLELITDQETKDITSRDIVIELAKNGMTEEAINYALAIQNFPIYESAVIRLAAELGVADNVNFVILMLQQINEEGLFDQVIENYIYSLVKNKKINQIEKVITYIEQASLKQSIIANIVLQLIQTNQLDSFDFFQNQLQSVQTKSSNLIAYGANVSNSHLEDYYSESINKINKFIEEEKIDFFDEASLYLINAKIEFDQENYEDVFSYINRYDKTLIKQENTKFDNIKLDTIKLLLAINKEKHVFPIIDSYNDQYQKISLLFLFDDKENVKAQHSQNKQILSFTKKIIK